jgi:RNA polymerase sigma factor (sigma-70 family)
MNYEKMDDERLVKYLRSNSEDSQGWTALLKRYHKLIWWHIARYGGGEDHDLYRDIQYAIWYGLRHHYRAEGSVQSYIGSIIANQVKQNRRANLKEPQVELEEIAGAMADTGSAPDQEIMDEETAKRVSGLLKQLKPKERRMLILRYLKYSHKEISSILGIRSEGASRKFLSKLMLKLSEEWQSAGVDAEELLSGMCALYQEGRLDEMLSC